MVERLVYKYLSRERVDVLENTLIRFTQAFALNDPFESRPNLLEMRRYFEERGEIYSRAFGLDVFEATKTAILAKNRIKKKFEQWQIEQDNSYVFLSLTRNRNNLLMWSHYCQSHCGFVIGFDGNHPFFNTQKFKEFSTLQEVKYNNKRPIVRPSEEHWSELADIFLFTKSTHRAYEEELRIVANPQVAKKVAVGNDGHNIYLFDSPMEIVKEVVLGHRMVASDQHRIANLLDNRYPAAILYQAELNQAEFDLNIAPVH